MMKGASMALVFGKLGGRIRLCRSIAYGMTTGDGLRLGCPFLTCIVFLSSLIIRIPSRKRTPGKPRVPLLINNEIRVDGIPVVSIALGGDEAALILPSILIR